VKFTNSITAKAAELGNKPIAIYEWVRNNVEFVPTYGSIQGADMCLQTMECNAFDTASLLIALLRASGIPARYAYGTVEIPIEKFMNWMGGFTDANSAMMFAAAGGIPTAQDVSGGKVTKVRIEHVWVEAWVDMMPSFGAIMGSGGKRWTPLDASFKQYAYNLGEDKYLEMNLNGINYIYDYVSDDSVTIANVPGVGYIDNIVSPYKYFSNIYNAGMPDVFVASQEHKGIAIKPETHQILLGSLPYKLIAKGIVYSEIEANNRHSVEIKVVQANNGEVLLQYFTTLPALDAKALSIHFEPFSDSDKMLIAAYGNIELVPAYLLNMVPVIKVDDATAVTGEPSAFGVKDELHVIMHTPGKSVDNLLHPLSTGESAGIIIDYSKTSSNKLSESIVDLYSTINGGVDPEGINGKFLKSIGMAYFNHLRIEESVYEKEMSVFTSKLPSEAYIGLQLDVEYSFGITEKAAYSDIVFDVGRNVYVPLPYDGNKNRKRDFLVAMGMATSWAESMFLERFFGVKAYSAAKILKIAHNKGIQILAFDAGNIGSLSTELQAPINVIEDIRNAVNAGNVALVPQSEISMPDWSGYGYIILNPDTGAGSYMISEGLHGARCPYLMNVKRNNCTLGESCTGISSILIQNGYYDRLLARENRIGRILAAAADWEGTRYDLQNADAEAGTTDCSNFVEEIYSTEGISLTQGRWEATYRGRTDWQYATLTANGLMVNSPIRGDLVYFEPRQGGTYGHVALVTGTTDTALEVIHAVTVSPTGPHYGVVYDHINFNTGLYSRIRGYARPIALPKN